MKAIFKKLQKFQSQVSTEIIKRQNYFDKRSENWQDSIKGDEYITNTECLEELNEALNEGLINLYPKDEK